MRAKALSVGERIPAMASPTHSPERIADILENALARPPSRTGARLVSERDLAKYFRVSHKQIRVSINLLEEKGLLARRQGSGTYVRRVPQVAPSGIEKINQSVDRLLQDNRLFAPAKPESLRRKPERESTRFNICIVSGVATQVAVRQSKSNQSIVDGVAARIAESGHRLVRFTYSEESSDRRRQHLDSFRKKLTERANDGYLVYTTHAAFFREALGDLSVPVVYLGSDFTEECTPLVRIDLLQAIERAVSLFAGQGHTRIGLIGLRNDKHSRAEIATYEGAMRNLGLSYRASDICDVSLSACREVVEKMFSRPDRPEAIYVSDDVVLFGVTESLLALGLTPGRDIAVITLACRGNELPPDFAWSCMEFTPHQLGRMAAQSLLRVIETAGAETCSYAHEARWRPGTTHLLRR